MLWFVTSPNILLAEANHISELGIKGQGIRLCFLSENQQIPWWGAWMGGGQWIGAIKAINLPHWVRDALPPRLESHLPHLYCLTASFQLHHIHMFGSGYFSVPIYYLKLLSFWERRERSSLLFLHFQSLTQCLVHGKYLIDVEYVTEQNQQWGVSGCPRLGCCLHLQVERTSDQWIGPSPMRPLISWAFWEMPQFRRLWLWCPSLHGPKMQAGVITITLNSEAPSLPISAC